MTVNKEISLQQAELASSLGISLDESSSLLQLMQALDKALGQKYLLEQARWFILSVYRHLTKANWDTISESGLSLEQQYELAEIYISSDKFKQSLITVLKDPRTRFTLLGFAKSRNLEKRVLSTTTKAYQHAKGILADKELVASKPLRKRGQASASAKSQSQATADTNSGADARPDAEAGDSVVNRRAARRGFADTSHADGQSEVEAESVSRASPDASQTTMSEEEFEELEEELSSGEKPAATNWTYETNEDRLSLLLGLAAGGGFCALMLWMFL